MSYASVGPPPPPRRNSNGKLVAIACVCVLVGGMVGFAVGIATSSRLADALEGWGQMFEGPENIEVAATVPDEVEIGREFEAVLEITNIGSEAQELNSIDIYDDYLDGFQVLEVSPRPIRKEEVGFFASYYFYEPIEPGQTVLVTLSLRAEKAGSYSGDADVCINNEFSFVTQWLETEVVEPAP